MSSSGNLIAGVDLLWTIAQVRPTIIDQHIQHVMRALQQKLAKDHVTNSVPPQAANAQQARLNNPSEPNQTAQDPREAEIQTKLILKTIDIISLRMGTLGEQRRPFLSVL